MKKRSLKAVFVLIICAFVIGIACIVATNNHGYSTAHNPKNEKVLEENLNSSLLTTQDPKEKRVTKTTTKASICENVVVTTQDPKEEVTKATTTTSICENVSLTSQTQMSKSQDKKAFSGLENTTTVQTTREKERKTSVSTVMPITEIQSQNTIIEDKPVEINQKTKKESTATNETIAVEKATTQLKTTNIATTELRTTAVATEIRTVSTTTTELETTTIATTELEVETTVITEPEITTIQIEEETDTQIKTITPKTNDCLIIGERVIELAYGPATQEMVDNNDVVQDTELWSDERNKYFFGHNIFSFSCLFGVELGDIITLVNDGVETKYQVFRCETGTLTEDRCNIESNVDGTYLIKTDFGCETIRMITCDSVFSPANYRLVVIGERIE